jgi:hypothetical protein
MNLPTFTTIIGANPTKEGTVIVGTNATGSIISHNKRALINHVDINVLNNKYLNEDTDEDALNN